MIVDFVPLRRYVHFKNFRKRETETDHTCLQRVIQFTRFIKVYLHLRFDTHRISESGEQKT